MTENAEPERSEADEARDALRSMKIEADKNQLIGLVDETGVPPYIDPLDDARRHLLLAASGASLMTACEEPEQAKIIATLVLDCAVRALVCLGVNLSTDAIQIRSSVSTPSGSSPESNRSV